MQESSSTPQYMTYTAHGMHVNVNTYTPTHVLTHKVFAMYVVDTSGGLNYCIHTYIQTCILKHVVLGTCSHNIHASVLHMSPNVCVRLAIPMLSDRKRFYAYTQSLVLLHCDHITCPDIVFRAALPHKHQCVKPQGLQHPSDDDVSVSCPVGCVIPYPTYPISEGVRHKYIWVSHVMWVDIDFLNPREHQMRPWVPCNPFGKL